MFNQQTFDFNFPLVIAVSIVSLILSALSRRDTLWCLLPAVLPMGYYIYKAVYPFATITFPMTPIIKAKIVWGFADGVMLFPYYIAFCGLGFLIGKFVRNYVNRFRTNSA